MFLPTNIYFTIWKFSFIYSISISGKRSNLKNYSVISILPTIPKLNENLLAPNNNLLYKNMNVFMNKLVLVHVTMIIH